jgi:hypothetical protein
MTDEEIALGVNLPSGWVRDSETLFLHSSGVRIERRCYRKQEGWNLVPVDLDRAVIQFTPDSAGLRKAFATFAGGALGPSKSEPSPRYKAARQDEKPEEPSDEEDESEDSTEESP